MDAGRALAAALRHLGPDQPVVLALPRGGVPVAAEIAASLGAPIDLILVRKIGVPVAPELAMGAVVDGSEPLVVRNDDVIAQIRISEAEFRRVMKEELAEIDRRRRLYLGDRPHPVLSGKTVIVTDDGIATGATMRAALQAVRGQNPKRLVLAVPVAPTSTLAELRDEADEIICLEDYEPFGAIGYSYDDFSQVSDQEVVGTLARFTRPAEEAASAPRDP
ncbi:Protein-L-isoaspartate O-methyltransferase [Lutibaculum baratangense AMV1]|uniref:Protein-L-isoaspartate O-methyltransferase n=1 Tax=Lutibaculum baratangense AMV1 TaxID=631454 RepID=V4THE3_9HYPH|nr:Protein-L-isoaspartate O-methyltransferase [Lutibaculum baratangense AMV1]